MKHSNKSLFVVLILALVLAGFYAIDFNSRQASVIALPGFSGTTEVKPSDEQPVNTLEDLNDAIVNITEETTPAVVTVFTTQTVRTPANPFSRFFEMPFGRGEDEFREFQREGLGSGVIVSEEGYILTNNHVVERADEVRVRTYDGQELEAEVVGADPQTDVAVLKVDTGNLRAIGLGDSDSLDVGEFVLAIGSPFGAGLAHSVSFGIVSGKGRAIGLAQQTGGYENFIQTDAAINPGNSGGALINMSGELVGINTAIASRSGGNQGVGFAIPVNLAKNIMTQLIETGEVSRGYLGIFWGGNVDQTMAKALDLDKAGGVIIGKVEEGTPADEAGLREGDVIVSLDDRPIEDWSSFRLRIASKKPGNKITLGIIRDGREQQVEVTLGELPSAQTASAGEPDQSIEEETGFSVQNLTADIARQLDLDPGTEGVIVTSVNRASDAYRQGLQQGDVITSIARQPVRSVSEFNEVMNQLIEKGNQVVLLHVIRGGNGLLIAFEL